MRTFPNHGERSDYIAMFNIALREHDYCTEIWTKEETMSQPTNEEIIEIIKEEVLFDPSAEVTDQSVLSSLDGWDSLALMGLGSVIADKYGVELSYEELHECKRVKDLLPKIFGDG